MRQVCQQQLQYLGQGFTTNEILNAERGRAHYAYANANRQQPSSRAWLQNVLTFLSQPASQPGGVGDRTQE